MTDGRVYLGLGGFLILLRIANCQLDNRIRGTVNMIRLAEAAYLARNLFFRKRVVDSVERFVLVALFKNDSGAVSRRILEGAAAIARRNQKTRFVSYVAIVEVRPTSKDG